MLPPPCDLQHLPGFLHYWGGELPGAGRGSATGGPEEDRVVFSMEIHAPAVPILYALQHLLERRAICPN